MTDHTCIYLLVIIIERYESHAVSIDNFIELSRPEYAQCSRLQAQFDGQEFRRLGLA